MMQKIVFVYNADSGVFNTLSDIGHKIFSPQTYQCSLCEITHSIFTVRGEWKSYIESLGVTCEFMHRDEFVKQYGTDEKDFPAVYIASEQGINRCLGPEEINQCGDMEELKGLLSSRCM